jgi:aspergillopepsin I
VDPAAPPSTTASEVAVTEKNDLEYLSPVDIGGTIMQLDFDTGSSDLYVATFHLSLSNLCRMVIN